MPQITFEAGTSEELVEQALRWALETLQASRQPTMPSGARELRSVVAHVQGQQARRFLRDVAERSRDGLTLPLEEAAQRYGRTADPGSFVGMVGAANRPMRRQGGRRLIEWVPTIRGYRMDRADAEVVLEALGG